jgi:superoxide dismutase, Cu-Zn family
MKGTIELLAAMALLAGGCNETKAGSAAAAMISETGAAMGTASFEDTTDGLKVTIDLTAVPGDGMHGMHLHATGDCGDSAADMGTVHHGAAGGHFNPGMVNHGCPNATPHHAGDLGNVSISGGAGKLELVTKDLTVAAGTNTIVGKALILHMNPDDCMSQPVGNAGARIGCAVITAK